VRVGRRKGVGSTDRGVVVVCKRGTKEWQIALIPNYYPLFHSCKDELVDIMVVTNIPRSFRESARPSHARRPNNTSYQ
jgi:hypothetical protein